MEKNRNRKKIIIFTVIALLLIVGIALSPLCNIREVEIVDLGEANENFDRNLFKVDSNFFLLDTKALSQKIMETNLLESVKIERKFPLKLRIQVEWKAPVISIKTGNMFANIDKNSYVLSFAERPVDFGFIDGIVLKYAKIGEVIITENDYITKNAVILHHLFLANESLFDGNVVKPNIYVDDSDIICRISDKYIINFGGGEEAELRFARAVAMYNELEKKGVKSGIINVKRKNHYIYETWK